MLPQQQKAIIRDDARRRRAALTDRATLSQAIWANLRKLQAFIDAPRIFSYANTSTEVETIPFFAEALLAGKTMVLPCTLQTTLRFFEVTSVATLSPGAYGILEPNLETQQTATPVEPRPGDLVLVPGIAFTSSGIRLGHGAGFYDRFLGVCDRRIAKAGLAYSAQIFPKLPEEPFDIRVDYLVTEHGATQCQP